MTKPSLLSSLCAVFRTPRDPQGRPLSEAWQAAAKDTTLMQEDMPGLLPVLLLGAGSFVGKVVSTMTGADHLALHFLVMAIFWPGGALLWRFILTRQADNDHPRFETTPSYLERFRIRGGPERERAFNNGLSMFVWLSRKLDDDMSGLREALIDVQQTGMRWREDSYRLPEAQETRGHFALVILAEYADRMYRDETLRASPVAREDLKQAAEATRTLLDSILTGRSTGEVIEFTSGVRALSHQIGAGSALNRRTRESGHA